MFLKELICISIFVIFSTLLAAIMVLAGFICQYKNETSQKNSTYECGVIPFDNAKVKFDIRYFNYAILFLIFDIETIFLYPFAVSINSLGLFAVIETILFVSILLIGLVFAIRKKMLRWI